MDLEVKGVAASRNQPRLFSQRKNSLQVCKPQDFPLIERSLQVLPPSFPPVFTNLFTHKYLGSAFPRLGNLGPPNLKIIIVLKWTDFALSFLILRLLFYHCYLKKIPTY